MPRLAFVPTRRQLARALGSVVIGLGSGCTTPAPGPTTVSAPGVRVERGALGLHQPKRVNGARVVGRVAADEQVDLVLGMKLHDRPTLDATLRRLRDPRSADYRRYFTPATFADRFGADAASYEQVASFVESAGFTITRRVPGRSTLSIRGSAATVERVFGTQLDLYEDAATKVSPFFYAPSAAFTMPASIADAVDTVVGLDDAYPFRPESHPGGSPSASPDAFPGAAVPADLLALYDVTASGLYGDGETVAILGTGFGPTSGDVKKFISTYSLTTVQAAQYTQVQLGGDNRDPVALANQEYGENLLDIDMVLSIAPKTNVVHVLTARNAPGLFEDGIAFIVNNVPQAHQVTVSYSSCEAQAAFSVLQTDTLLAQAQAQGQTWFFASGDDGTDACKDLSSAAPLGVNYPASSPHAFGVGGTQYASGQETVWGDPNTGAGGGGLSQIFTLPDWQVGISPYTDQDARMVPDVSALAGEPGVNVATSQQLFTEYGTSAAAPMWGGVWALIDESRGGIGMPDGHEKIYAIGATDAFHDITSGTNADGTTPGYTATPGFDLATGWGTPDVVNLIGELQ